MRYRGLSGEEQRNLRDALETTRDVQAYGRRHVGQMERVKRLLRSAGCRCLARALHEPASAIAGKGSVLTSTCARFERRLGGKL